MSREREPASGGTEGAWRAIGGAPEERRRVSRQLRERIRQLNRRREVINRHLSGKEVGDVLMRCSGLCEAYPRLDNCPFT